MHAADKKPGHTQDEENQIPDQQSSQTNQEIQEQNAMGDTSKDQSTKEADETIQNQEDWYSAYDITEAQIQQDTTEEERAEALEQPTDQPTLNRLPSELVDQILDQQQDTGATNVEQVSQELVEHILEEQPTDQPTLNRLSSELVDQILDQQQDTGATNVEQVSQELVEHILEEQPTDQPTLNRLSSELVDQILDQKVNADAKNVDQIPNLLFGPNPGDLSLGNSNFDSISNRDAGLAQNAADAPVRDSRGSQKVEDLPNGGDLHQLGGVTESEQYLAGIRAVQGLQLDTSTSPEIASEMQQLPKPPAVQEPGEPNLAQNTELSGTNGLTTISRGNAASSSTAHITTFVCRVANDGEQRPQTQGWYFLVLAVVSPIYASALLVEVVRTFNSSVFRFTMKKSSPKITLK
ncbi:hypothetical protein CLF_108366 [Clonorchis sinensis]|uniref:Uncharacterized protein n=1 Tax=Clonorchis sinensis TaxID=79923 RepID=G7YHY5_CLOSI|nr:hypothetical protein CLF_108366 [Clonorchis sinensis]